MEIARETKRDEQWPAGKTDNKSKVNHISLNRFYFLLICFIIITNARLDDEGKGSHKSRKNIR